MDFNELENRVVSLTEIIKKHDLEISDLKSNNKELTKAINDNTLATRENVLVMKNFGKELKEHKDKLDKVIEKENINILIILRKLLLYVATTIIGGMIGYLLF